MQRKLAPQGVHSAKQCISAHFVILAKRYLSLSVENKPIHSYRACRPRLVPSCYLTMSNARLEALLQKKKAIEAQIQQQRARERQKQRKADTRRKIIAGALALEHMEANPDSEFAAQMRKLINRYTKRDADRALFDLEPRQSNDAPGLREEFPSRTRA